MFFPVPVNFCPLALACLGFCQGPVICCQPMDSELAPSLGLEPSPAQALIGSKNGTDNKVELWFTSKLRVENRK